MFRNSGLWINKLDSYPLTKKGFQVFSYATFTIFLAVIIGFALLNPLWAYYAPYLKHLDLLPSISAPVDGMYYLENAKLGYRWDTATPLSLLFHPLLSVLLGLLPTWLPTNVWFWLISLLLGTASLVLIYQLTLVLTDTPQLSVKLLPLCLIAPGGLILATGNAEIPCLFFTLVLLLSILRWQRLWLTICSAVLAILTKPNALYMIPVLLIYFIWGANTQSSRIKLHALTGILGIAGAWLLWMLLVDWHTGIFGTYWNVRMNFNPGVAGTFPGFFDRLVRSFLYDGDFRDQIRYSVAIVVPIVSLVIFGFIPLADEQHRYALAAGVFAMMFVALIQGNPNKIIVYSTTLPGHFSAHLLAIVSIASKATFKSNFTRGVVALTYTTYCVGMLLVFIFGTPLRWYH